MPSTPWAAANWVTLAANVCQAAVPPSTTDPMPLLVLPAPPTTTATFTLAAWAAVTSVDSCDDDPLSE